MKHHPENDDLWYIPANVSYLADGATMIRPGKAVLRTTPARTEQLTGISPKQLRNLADEGYIRRGNPTRGKVYYYPAEVERLNAYIEQHPDFWANTKTRKAYRDESAISR